VRNKVRVRVRVRIRVKDRVRDRVTSGFFFLFLSFYIAPFALRRIQKAVCAISVLGLLFVVLNVLCVRS